MTWFEELTGFYELSPDHVRKNIVVVGKTLKSLANGKTMTSGLLETPSLGDLRGCIGPEPGNGSKLSVREVVADVQNLHTIPNAGALFQAASQFNLLEMVSPNKTPELGVGIYEADFTQGPACAIAAGAGTIYRNYFASVNGQVGQSRNNQIDCLADLGAALGNTECRLWEMQNGYAMATREGLVEITKRLRTASNDERDVLRKMLRIGIQWDTQVTLNNSDQLVSQAYCSALPVAYSNHSPELWEAFARLVLEASYEATLCAAILNSQRTGNNRVYLTLLGGGAFGNETHWIMDAIARALRLHKDWNLDVAVVSYGRSNKSVLQLIEQFH
jgi:hypothetical protein